MQRSDFEDLDKLETTHWWFKGMRAISSVILSYVEIPGNAQERKALDAGCGVGGNLRWLESYVPREQIYGIDIDSDACSFVPQPYHSRVTQSSVTSLPFEDNSFDFVTSFDVLVQVPGAEGEKQAVQEMLRIF